MGDARHMYVWDMAKYVWDIHEILLRFVKEYAWDLLGIYQGYADMQKVASMQALLADKFLENCGLFWINTKCLADIPMNDHKST